MGVTDDNSIDNGDVLDVARFGSVSLRAHEAKWRASIFEYGIEKDSQTRRVFDIVAGMT